MSRIKRPLSEFVNEYMATRTEQSYDKYITKELCTYFAKTGMRDMARKVGGTPKTVLITPNSVNFVSWPNDYLAYTKIGYLDQNNVIRTLTRNDKINFRYEFLKSDPSGDIILDSDGIETLSLTSANKTRLNSDSVIVSGDANSYDVYWNLYSDGRSLGHYLGFPGGRNSKGYYRPNDNGIELSSDVNGDIVLEYIADETMKSNPSVYQAMEEALRKWILWQYISDKVNVPMGVVATAKNDHYALRRVAKRNLRSFTLSELLTQSRIASAKLSAKN